MTPTTPPLSKLDPSEIIIPSSLEEYEAGLDVIWWQLVRLNSNLYILDRLYAFPTDLFLEPGSQTFFSLTKLNFVDSCILTITKLLTDDGSDVLTLPQLKNRVVGKWAKEEHQQTVKDALKSAKFSRTIRSTRKKIKWIRDNFVAHLQVDSMLRPKLPNDSIAISLQEIKAVAEGLNGLFHVLCLGHQRALVPIDYDPYVQNPPSYDSRTDIEQFLDLIVQASSVFNLPEEHSEHWHIVRESFSSEEVDILNSYRKRLGRTEV